MRRQEMPWWFLFSYGSPFYVDNSYFPAQQSGTSEAFDELLSECTLFLQQSGSSEAVVSFSLQQSLVSLSLWLLSVDALADVQPVTLNAAASAMIQTINIFFIWLLPFSGIKKRKSYADFLRETQNCPSHSERTASHNAEICLLHFTHKCTHTHGRIGGHGVFSFHFQCAYCITVFSICLISYRYSWL